MELHSKVKLECKDDTDSPVTYFYGTILSYDGSYIIAGDSYMRRIFDNKGKFLKSLKGRDIYTIYQYSKTEFIGFKNLDDTYTKSCLMAIDFIADTERQIYEFDSYVSAGNFSRDMTQLVYEVYPKIMYLNLKDKSEKKEIVKEYYSVYKYCFKDNKVGVFYSTNYYNMWAALFEDGVLKWKQKINKSYVDIRSFVFSESEEDCLVALEMDGLKLKIYYFEENFSTNYCMKSIRNITFQYPLLSYVWGTKELWIQDMENNVSVFYFTHSIVGMENDNKVKNQSKEPMSLGMILDYYDYYHVTDFVHDKNEKKLVVNKRKIMKSEIGNAKIKGYNRIKMENFEKKMAEESVLIQVKNNLIALSLESKQGKCEIKKSISKGNIIELKRFDAIFFWKYGGDKIEMMKLPYNPTNPKAIQKVYEADEDIKFVKPVIINNKEYLSVCDESKFVKILSIEENKVSIYKDYFVDSYFASYSDENSMKQFRFCNDMLYSSSGGYSLQEKGKEKEAKF